MSECNGVGVNRLVLPWKTVELINIVTKYDSCMSMPIRELAKEADFWKCRGKLKAQNKHRRHLTNAIIKKWLKFCFERYTESAKAGHVEKPSPVEHVGYVEEMKLRGLKVENFNW